MVEDRSFGVVVLALPDFSCPDVGEVDGELEVVIEMTAAQEWGRECGLRAVSKGRRDTLVRDVVAFGLPVRLRAAQTPLHCRLSVSNTSIWSAAVLAPALPDAGWPQTPSRARRRGPARPPAAGTRARLCTCPHLLLVGVGRDEGVDVDARWPDDASARPPGRPSGGPHRMPTLFADGVVAGDRQLVGGQVGHPPPSRGFDATGSVNACWLRGTSMAEKSSPPWANVTARSRSTSPGS